jgi:hypothetical protein
MVQYCGLRLAGFGFLIFSACSNKCADMPVVSSNNNTCTTHTSCKDGTQVMECHPPGNHGFYYSSNNQFLLPQALWPFFKQFALP